MARETWTTRSAGPDDVAAIVADSVGDHRKRAGLTQAQLAEAMRGAGFSWSNMTTANTERQAHPLTPPELLALAAILQVPVVDLIAPADSVNDYEMYAGVSRDSVRELIVGRDPDADPSDPWPAADELLAAWQREG